jgi:hypothetical protein
MANATKQSYNDLEFMSDKLQNRINEVRLKNDRGTLTVPTQNRLYCIINDADKKLLSTSTQNAT